MTCFRLVPVTLALVLAPIAAAAQATPVQAPAAPAASAPAAEESDPDARVDALQPDFNLAALPTTLRMPLHKLAFRVTHRFMRPLGQGDFGDLASDFFGFDSAAQIGLELRYGLARGTQIGVHRTSDRSIQIFGQHNVWNERNGHPLGVDAMATLEGNNNLRQRYRSTLGFVASRNVGRRAALYAEPLWIANSNPAADAGFDNNTVMLGLGGRLRVRPSTYLVAEISPRLGGYDPGVSQVSFGLEGRAGGHLFQLNISNGFGTTLAQVASGASNNDDWHIGFNIARKFF
jgi:hypothetical protein